ncbi:MAG: Formylglycine-generating enzyme, required for sulfatase activity, contains SUMF1/FGE domain [Candidatus Electronema aureum]|uniref:Formylglycine-generating enzyme, required for sulfatase activity, contains SUMF1/FGE domain n=1 Tax=Candidatus Electronema aureum TaxID=2005002 RepID=A0A521FYW7_9BACT|nr:MAG: Formylglycine-generating enzyme, required for sulfatase activity, contains SUMF1/FGE domain [Candidatus Electronema aureum]
MADEKKSFGEIFAIVVTAIAAVLGGLSGVAALIVALNGDGKEGAAKPETASSAQAASAAQPSSVPPANDEAARRAKAEAEAAKAEAEQAKTEAAEAKAQAAELERKLAEIASAEMKAEEEAATRKQGDITVDDFTGMKLAYVPGGCFNMGSPPNEEGRGEDEGPVHKVCVDSFWMGQFEVTQGQWEKIMGANPSKFKKGGNYPVENVSWNDAQGFVKKLNSRTGKNYRLPTEAEWEYACRADGSGKYCGGDEIDAVAWHAKNSGKATHVAGGKEANALGLHDMSGNVYEWCADWYDSGYYASSPKDNPQGPETASFEPETASFRVFRGGDWRGLHGRAAGRGGSTPEFRSDFLGFRLALPVQQQ